MPLVDRDIRRTLAYVTPYWRRLGLVVGLSLLGTALSLALPYLSKLLVDRALLGRDLGMLLAIVGVSVAITLGSFALNVVSGLRYTRVSAEILFDMRLALFQHLQRLSPRFYARMPLGQIASRINSDIGEIQRVVTEVALAWIGNVLFLAGSVAFLVVLDPILFVISLLLLPPAIVALILYRRKLESSVATVRDRSAAIGTFLIESLQGMKLVVSLNGQERANREFRHRNDGFMDAVVAMRRLAYLSGGMPGIILGVGGAIVFLIGGWRVIDGAISMGTLVAFLAYQMRLFGPAQALMGLYASVATARVSLRRVQEILDTPVEVTETSRAAAMTKVQGDVIFDHVRCNHDRGIGVLDDVSLVIRVGERVAIVGRSGEGKSTIADLLVRHVDPDEGRILIDGRDLRDIKLADLRRNVVVVDQDPFIFNATIAENIRYACPEATDAEVLGAARAAGLGDFIVRLPLGVGTQVGERGRALSAGERQRIAIARAFLADPAVLVLDEATGSLDPETEAQVVAGYEAVMRGRTTIVISHRPELARRADRVVVLDGGRIVETRPGGVAYVPPPSVPDIAPTLHLVR